MSHYHTESKTTYEMAKIVAALSYLTIIGWMLAIILYGFHKSTFARFHLRQSLGLIITAAVLSFIPLIGWLLNIGVVFLWFLALYYALAGHKRSVPLLGDFYQRHLDFIC
ncbi:hypothetical protein SG34_013115 [Thalassomonas viridans]|uniref:DUF4870 domain-containing protein n=1 Tax=Thalassomonas viridans TaxID=137584 RepID=A0AAE9Z7U7_9GAMM|nr:hypothetical protein [Thalassomonas viridans]WDE07749.1 hypothetical protein SG34_013115 [Thalassomonas viridans]